MINESSDRHNALSTGAWIFLGVIAFLLAFGSASRHAGAEPPPSASTVDKSFSFFEPVKPPRPVQVMAHRGLSRLAPENTAPAIERCIADGLEWAEVDVRLTKDGVHVLAHDSALEGKTNGRGDERADVERFNRSTPAPGSRRYAGTRILTPRPGPEARERESISPDCKRGREESGPRILAPAWSGR